MAGKTELRLRNLHRRLFYQPPTSRLWCAALDRFRPVGGVLFVATTGRSGTGLLARLLDRADGVVARHEAKPEIHGRPMAERNRGEDAWARRLYWGEKAVRVRRAGAGHALYAETNHMFIKSFADWATEDFGDRLRVVHLRRDRLAVARSIYALGTLPDSGGNHWYLDYRAPGNHLRLAAALDSPPFADDFYKCLWYWHEIEARVKAYRRRYPRVPVIPLDFADMLTPAGAMELLGRLGLEARRGDVARLLERPVNPKTGVKRARGRNLGAEDAAAMAARFDRLLREAGHGS